jgi:hypothetical protein
MFVGKAWSLPKSRDHESASLGKALALPTNIRFGWNSLPGTNTQAYYENSQITDKNVLHHWPLGQCYKTFMYSHPLINKLERLLLGSI